MVIKYIPPTTEVEIVKIIRETVFFALSVAEMSASNQPLKVIPRAYGQAEKLLAALKGKQTRSLENLAYAWFSLTLTSATTQFIDFLRTQAPLIAANKDAAVNTFIAHATSIDGPAKFSASTIEYPQADPVFRKAFEALPHLITDLTPLVRFDLDAYVVKFENCITASSFFTFSHHNDLLTPLYSTQTGVTSEAAVREIAWNRHGEWIQSRFQNDPVFSPDGANKTPLSSVYLPLRGYWHEAQDSTDSEEPNEKRSWKANACLLHDELHKWVAARSGPYLRVVAGGPGSGKSSLAKAFSCEIHDTIWCRVVLIELQQLSFNGDLYADIGRYLVQRHKPAGDGGSPGFPSNPLDWIKGLHGTTLIVFDGLDELTFDAAAAKEVSRKFVLNVRQLVDRLNNDGTSIKALILGRNASCQEGIKDAALPVSTIINVAPIRRLSNEDFRPHEYARTSEVDERTSYPDMPDDFLADQRPHYWELWQRSQGKIGLPIPEAVTHKDLADLNVEPLLLHLLILSDFCGDRWHEAADNKNVVYEDILRKVHQRNVSKGLALADYSADDFMLLMECLGLAGFRSNVRGGSEADFLEVRDIHARHRKRALSNFEAASLRNVVLQTHARSIEGTAPGFEFVHKSFGEFLAARGVVSFAVRSAERIMNLDEPASCEVVAEDWVRIFGLCDLSSEIAAFIRLEVLRRAPRIEIGRIKEGIQILLQWVSAQGFPSQKVFLRSFRFLEVVQAACECVLVEVCSSVASASLNASSLSPEVRRMNFGDAEGFSSAANSLIHRLKLSNRVASLDSWHFSHQYFSDGFQGLSFKDCIFSDSRFFHDAGNNGEFEGVKFDNCLFIQSTLRASLCFRVEFSSVDFHHCSFSDAYFDGVIFDQCDLDTLILHSGYLREVTFSRCNFGNLSILGSRLIACDFRHATGLSQATLEGAFGVKEGPQRSHLPDGLTYPLHWHTQAVTDGDLNRAENEFELAYRAWSGESKRD